MKKALVTIAAVISMSLVAAVAARAEVTYDHYLYDALDQNGHQIVGGTYVMALDMNNNGWGGGTSYTSPTNTLNAPSDSWLWDTGDLILGRGVIGSAADGYDPGTADAFGKVQGSTLPAGYDVGQDPYYVLWFNTPYSATATGPGQGQYYGAELLGYAAPNGATITDPIGTQGHDANFRTTVVPEPASMFLGLLGGISLIARRRFNRKVA